MDGNTLAVRHREQELFTAAGRIVNGTVLPPQPGRLRDSQQQLKLVHDRRIPPPGPALNALAAKPLATTPLTTPPHATAKQPSAPSPPSKAARHSLPGPDASWGSIAAWVEIAHQQSEAKQLAMQPGGGAGLPPTPARLAQNDAELSQAAASKPCPAVGPKLSKAQRKNLKRLEKRAAHRACNGSSELGSSEVRGIRTVHLARRVCCSGAFARPV